MKTGKEGRRRETRDGKMKTTEKQGRGLVDKALGGGVGGTQRLNVQEMDQDRLGLSLKKKKKKRFKSANFVKITIASWISCGWPKQRTQVQNQTSCRSRHSLERV